MYIMCPEDIYDRGNFMHHFRKNSPAKITSFTCGRGGSMIYRRAGEAMGEICSRLLGGVISGLWEGLGRSLLGRPASRVWGRLMATCVERLAGVCHWSCSRVIKGGVGEADRYGEVVFPFNAVMVFVVLCLLYRSFQCQVFLLHLLPGP